MSRVGKRPISIPNGVTVELLGDVVKVKGPKGELTQGSVEYISVAVEDSKVVLVRSSESKPARSNHGLLRSLINNMVIGVSAGFSKQLKVIGTGYRADVKGSNLVMNLGYSHLIEYPIPSGIKISVSKDNTVTVGGIDKQQVGQVAAELRAFRKPDRYKGKGVRYVDEVIILKTGKTA